MTVPLPRCHEWYGARLCVCGESWRCLLVRWKRTLHFVTKNEKETTLFASLPGLGVPCMVLQKWKRVPFPKWRCGNNILLLLRRSHGIHTISSILDASNKVNDVIASYRSWQELGSPCILVYGNMTKAMKRNKNIALRIDLYFMMLTTSTTTTTTRAHCWFSLCDSTREEGKEKGKIIETKPKLQNSFVATAQRKKKAFVFRCALCTRFHIVDCRLPIGTNIVITI